MSFHRVLAAVDFSRDSFIGARAAVETARLHSNRHARKHFQESAHPIVQSFEPGEDWRWCYVDETEV